MRQESSLGHSLTQIGILATLDRAGPTTLGDLAGIERVAPPTITKAVATLVADGLVEKAADPDDRRICRALLTTAGRREVAAHAQPARRLAGHPPGHVGPRRPRPSHRARPDPRVPRRRRHPTTPGAPTRERGPPPRRRRHVPLAARPQLPPVLRRPAGVPDRQLADDGRPDPAGAAAHPLRGGHRRAHRLPVPAPCCCSAPGPAAWPTAATSAACCSSAQAAPWSSPSPSPRWSSAATPPCPAIYALALVQGVLTAFDNPARRAFVVEMVPAGAGRPTPSASTAPS